MIGINLWYEKLLQNSRVLNNAHTCGQGGRTWQPFVGDKNGHENFRQARIVNGEFIFPKAQRSQSYNKFKQKSWWNLIFRISTKHQLQNLNQTPANVTMLSLSLHLLRVWHWQPLPAVERLHNFFSNIFTALRNCTDLTRQLASFTAIKSTKRHRVSPLVSEWQG